MSVSSVFVVTNALRLRFFKPNAIEPEAENGHTQAGEPEIGAVLADADIDEKGGNQAMEKIMAIKGMQCAHCKAAVEKALNALEGVEAQVELARGTANITLSAEVTDATLINAVTGAGYEVISVEKAEKL
jgi:P-type Cu+ transporter